MHKCCKSLQKFTSDFTAIQDNSYETRLLNNLTFYELRTKLFHMLLAVYLQSNDRCTNVVKAYRNLLQILLQFRTTVMRLLNNLTFYELRTKLLQMLLAVYLQSNDRCTNFVKAYRNLLQILLQFRTTVMRLLNNLTFC